MTNRTSTENPAPSATDVEAELAAFEAAERARLGLDPAGTAPRQWHDPNPNRFEVGDRATTTLLVAGLTHAHDLFVRAALAGAGFRVKTLDCPDNAALRVGKEFGNRGQCNPTYFTVGNLIKHLVHLRDEVGMPRDEIIRSHVFITAGACGPCRFGMYVTEYRKALRDSGFEGFRVLLVSQSGGVQSADGGGLVLRKRDVLRAFEAVMLGDVLNALMYRIRPYEVEPGATDRAIDECRRIVANALEHGRSLFRAATRCRRILRQVAVDRTRIKPRVAIIGEFWAMTTEGDGNYKLQAFLEEEGAEVEIQLVTAWLLYLTWEARFDTGRREKLRGADAARYGLAGKSVAAQKWLLWATEKGIRALFQTYARLCGLRDYHLPDMDELAKITHRFYDNHVRGGEGHMEVGKLIQNVVHNKVNMTLSVKPFGCMPSSGVSDGVQTIITEMYPHAIFLPIETSGDAATNAYSRIQMQLFKAKRAAEQEVAAALAEHDMTEREFETRAARHQRALHRSPHRAGCTAADLAHEVAGA